MSLNLHTTYLRVRPDASVEPLPVDDTFWPRLIAGELGTFPGDFVVVPRRVWHAAKVHRPSRLLFITPGEGTCTRAGD